MSARVFTDWQTWVTLGIGLVALAYLVRRWAPSWRALWQHPDGMHGMSCDKAPAGAQPPGPGCAAGRGGCGSSGMPQRDHRITVQRRTH